MAEKKLVNAWGETKTLVQWAEDSRCSVVANTISCRINRGWDPERAISEPSNLNGGDFAYAKLTEEDIPEIFRLREEELWSFKELAEHYGVTGADIGYVLQRKVWGWVPVKHEYSHGRVWQTKEGTRRRIPNNI